MPDVYRRPSVVLAQDSYWDAAITGMDDVVNAKTGTAHKSGIGSPVRFAGKTGTAQVYRIAQGQKAKTSGVPEHLQDHALFVAFAPVTAPRIAIAVVVEHGGGGSRTAAPIARRLIDYYFRDEPAAQTQTLEATVPVEVAQPTLPTGSDTAATTTAPIESVASQPDND